MRWVTLLCELLAFSSCVTFTGTAGKSCPEPQEILQRFRAARQAYPIYHTKTVEMTIGTDSFREGRRVYRELSEYVTDGNRISLLSYRWRKEIGDDEHVPGLREVELDRSTAQRVSFLWDGKDYYFYKVYSGEGEAYITRNSKKPKMPVTDHQQPYFGVFFGDHDSVDQTLAKAEDLTVREGTVGGHSCYVVEGDTIRGEYEVRFDPEYGYNIVRALVIRDAEDIVWEGVPLGKNENVEAGYRGIRPRHCTKIEVALDDVQFKMIGNVWVPVEMKYVHIQTYADGRVITNARHHRREFVDLDPDLERLGPFVPDIANGTPVWIMGEDSTVYRWQNGKLELVMEDGTVVETPSGSGQPNSGDDP